MEALKGDYRLPRYQRLADQIRDEIVRGDRKPGDRLPSENILAKEYHLATGTVRKALSQLVDEGILERFHGKGTFVRRPQFDKSLFRFFRFRDPQGEVIVPESQILRRTREPIPSFIAGKLKVKEGEFAIHFQRLRLIKNQPVLLEEIWLPLPRFKELLKIDTSNLGPLLYPIYDSVCGQFVLWAEEELTVELPDSETAKTLRIDESEPIMVIDRLARGYDDVPLEWRRYRGPASNFHYRTEIH